uniref:Uncharacterized protein n=1 Tax=Romanomermis culicivorax TaxID=13658 RepID=A0A915IQI0_ROMCU
MLRAQLFVAINKRFNVKPNHINKGDFDKDNQRVVDMINSGNSKKLTMFSDFIGATYLENGRFQSINLSVKGDDHREFRTYMAMPKVKDGETFLNPH